MSEAEVLYSDVKFKKKKGDTTEAVSSSLDTTYSEVRILGSQPSNEQPEAASSSLDTTYSEFKILETQPSNEQPASQQVVSNGGSKVRSQKVALLIFCIILAVVVIAFCYVLNNYMQTKGMHKKPKAEHDDLEKYHTDHSCPKCDKGWEEFGGKCYYFSTNTSSWNESRCYCRSRGGDLVKIDSREEQIFLTKEVSHKMNNDEVKFWIGLTDSEEEGNWFWVDGSPLNTSLSFWRKGENGKKDEPDDWKGERGEYPEGEDCVRMGEKGRLDLLEIWTDKSCDMLQRSICEKQALNCTQ